MLSPQQRRWALAFALLEMGPLDELPASTTECRERLRARYGILSGDQTLAYFRARRRGDAYEIAHLITVAASAAGAGYLDAETAWHVIWAAAQLARRTYTSWQQLADAYEAGLAEISDGRGSAEVEIRRQLADPESPWVALPWDVMGAAARQRVLRATCEACGARPSRPSPTAFIYCDRCGALVAYDVAAEIGAVVASETLQTLARGVAETGDRDTYRTARRALATAWLDACPQLAPIRVRDPVYRERYLAYLAEAETVAAFDSVARERERAMHAATAALAFATVDGRPRVAVEPYRALIHAALAYEARRDELFEPAVYALHPDGASRALQRRIGHARFVQGWLPYLGELEAGELIAHTGLDVAHDDVPAVPTRQARCMHCGAMLDVIADARRVVCEHCGQLADVALR